MDEEENYAMRSAEISAKVRKGMEKNETARLISAAKIRLFCDIQCLILCKRCVFTGQKT